MRVIQKMYIAVLLSNIEIVGGNEINASYMAIFIDFITACIYRLHKIFILPLHIYVYIFYLNYALVCEQQNRIFYIFFMLGAVTRKTSTP